VSAEILGCQLQHFRGGSLRQATPLDDGANLPRQFCLGQSL
jgi:hypothetical protein